MLIRPVTLADLDAVTAIEAACYPAAMCEGQATYADRIAVAAASSWIAESGGQPVAYLFAYPSVAGKVAPLGAAFKPASKPDCLYLHDLAVSPSGRGAGSLLVRHAIAWSTQARLAHLALVSVAQAGHYWLRHDFASTPVSGDAAQALASYGEGAQYMTRPLRQPMH
ncbi:GNAT family N-acetyltransferase [Chitinibacteraceae bacterium HSL-7]